MVGGGSGEEVRENGRKRSWGIGRVGRIEGEEHGELVWENGRERTWGNGGGERLEKNKKRGEFEQANDMNMNGKGRTGFQRCFRGRLSSSGER